MADKNHQERYWLSSDGDGLDDPTELVNSLDDVVFDGFIQEFSSSFSNSQKDAAKTFADCFNAFLASSPNSLDPKQVLVSKDWNSVTLAAKNFLAVFPENWTPAKAGSSNL
jgi:hypothetical protein